jgi:hypothetical protein
VVRPERNESNDWFFLKAAAGSRLVLARIFILLRFCEFAAKTMLFDAFVQAGVFSLITKN